MYLGMHIITIPYSSNCTASVVSNRVPLAFRLTLNLICPDVPLLGCSVAKSRIEVSVSWHLIRLQGHSIYATPNPHPSNCNAVVTRTESPLYVKDPLHIVESKD